MRVECASFQDLNRPRSRDIPFPARSRIRISEISRKWDSVRTRSIQILKTSALCFSRESSLSSCMTVSCESIVLPRNSIVPVWADLADLTRQASGHCVTYVTNDSSNIVLDVLRLLSREKNDALVFRTWIDCDLVKSHFLEWAKNIIPNLRKNEIYRERDRFKSWKLAHSSSLAKVKL